jgi:hypothetical protein
MAADPAAPRPWTPSAAMEPVPPLAPPPARPGAGMPVLRAARAPSTGAPLRTVFGLISLALVIAAVVIVVLVLGH